MGMPTEARGSSPSLLGLGHARCWGVEVVLRRACLELCTEARLARVSCRCVGRAMVVRVGGSTCMHRVTRLYESVCYGALCCRCWPTVCYVMTGAVQETARA